MVDVFIGFLSGDVQHIVDGNVANQLALLIDHGHGSQIVLAEQVHDHFLILLDGYLGRHGLHQVRQQRGGCGNQQPLRCNGARQAAVVIGRVNVENLAVDLCTAQVFDGFTDCLKLRHAQYVRRHQPTSGILVILEKLFDLLGLFDRQPLQKLLRLIGGEFPEHVGGVFRRHLGNHLGQAVPRQFVDNLVADAFVQQGDQLRGRTALQCEDDARPLHILEQLDDLGHVGGVHTGEVGAQLVLIPLLEDSDELLMQLLRASNHTNAPRCAAKCRKSCYYAGGELKSNGARVAAVGRQPSVRPAVSALPALAE